MDDPRQYHHAAIAVIPGIEDQRLKGLFGRTLGWRDAGDNGFEHLVDPGALLGADQKGFARVERQRVLDLLLRRLDVRARQVDLVDHRDDLEPVGQGELGVGERLSFDALRSVHHQQRAFAGREAARDLVGEVHVARRVDEVQLVFIAVAGAIEQADSVGLDGDAALALEVHGVEHLLRHLALGERARHLEQPVGQRGLAVVDVGDNREVADISGFCHKTAGVAKAPGSPVLGRIPAWAPGPSGGKLAVESRRCARFPHKSTRVGRVERL